MFKSNCMSIFFLITSFLCFTLYLLNKLFNFQLVYLLLIMFFSLLGTIFTLNLNDNTYKKTILLFGLIIYLIIILGTIVFKMIFK